MNIEDFLKKLSEETERGREVKKKKKGKEKSVKLGHISAPIPSSKKKNKIKPPKPKKKKKIELQVYYDRIGRTVAIDDFLIYFDGMKGFRVYYVSMADKEGRLLVCKVSGECFNPGGEVIFGIMGARGLWFSRKTWYLDEVLPKNSFFIMSPIDINKKIYNVLW